LSCAEIEVYRMCGTTVLWNLRCRSPINDLHRKLLFLDFAARKRNGFSRLVPTCLVN
jgi:hypothetical protein